MMNYQFPISNFHLQYALTILTIALIPLMLWLAKTRNVRMLTYIVFLLLIVADLVMYFISNHFPSYLYLSIITLLALFLIPKRP